MKTTGSGVEIKDEQVKHHVMYSKLRDKEDDYQQDCTLLR